MGLSDAGFVDRVNSPMHADQGGSLRDHGRVLRSGLLPSYVEAMVGGIVRRMNLGGVRCVGWSDPSANC
jgi:hypothetical protein